MEIQIIEEPIRFRLYGNSTIVENQKYGEAGFRLMNEMWNVVRREKIETTGINHWVYMADERMFVGVVVKNPERQPMPHSLVPFEFELMRYLRHVHIGPYETLPKKWQALKAELVARGEAIASPSLEVYGHASDDPSKAETTILIGLRQKA